MRVTSPKLIQGSWTKYLVHVVHRINLHCACHVRIGPISITTTTEIDNTPYPQHLDDVHVLTVFTL